jgi:hypothetical protein
MFLVYYFTHSYFRNLVRKCIFKSDLDANTQEPQVNPSTTSLPNLAETQETLWEDRPPLVRYSIYSLQSA